MEPSTHPSSLHPHIVVDMDLHLPISDPPSSSSPPWDWPDLLDLTVDDQFLFSLDSPHSHPAIPLQDTPPLPLTPDRVRKRDPRLVCPNFLEGRVPCACPEVDDKLEEEEGRLPPGKKRARMARIGPGMARCQVPGCEADISELKGYHKRHRVCMGCANASAVLLNGDSKRYCQQCGKFHLLSDFDEGKRSCRRKLERHNNRRRRKPLESKSSFDKEPQEDLRSEYAGCDGEQGKDGLMGDKEVTIELEGGHVSTLHSAPNSQNLSNSDSGAASGETLIDGGKDDSKFSLSPSYCDNRSAYSSMCPTGRVSFKLYDWNPVEFPRRLRHQIFKWLASMPVELEGYIRPGCTILTAFIAMPAFMWQKLFEDPMSFMHDLVIVPGKMLSRKGHMLIHLNDMVFHVPRDGTSIMRVKMEEQAPRLHYVHPMYFEVGKPIEFIACGRNLLQPKFRFLVSFAGKYLEYNYCAASSCGQSGGDSSLNHLFCKMFVPYIEPNPFGPAFIEVENESGLSNFIPILVGDRGICSEIETIQQRLDDVTHLSDCSQCEVLASRQLTFSEFVVDVAWLLREPSPENIQQIMSSSQIQRCNSLLKFLIYHESTAILGKIIENLKIMMNKMEVVNSRIDDSCDADMRLLQNYMDHANDIFHQKAKETLQLEYAVRERESLSGGSSESDMPSVSDSEQDVEKTSNVKSGLMRSSTSTDRSDLVKPSNRDVIMNVNNLGNGRSSKSCSHMFSNKVLKPRPTIFVIAVVAVCFGACAVFLHPDKVSRFAISVRRCLTDRF